MQIRSRFPFFRKNNYIYLDSSATTQVPDVVIRGITQSLEFRGNPNRSSHNVAERSLDLLDEAREVVASFINAKSNEIVFNNNTTDAINIAIDSVLHSFEKGDVIIVSIAEHHSNLLPYLKTNARGSKIKLLGLKDGIIDVEEVKSALSKKTKLVAIAHCSNVLGNINAVEEIGKLIKSFNKDIFYVVDGTQAVAHIPIDVKSMNADFYAFSSHKMYGPDGVGVLYVSEEIHHHIKPVRAGGGTVKDIAITRGKNHDTLSPDYDSTLSVLEGGTPNTSNIVGLSKAIGFLRSIGLDKIREHEIFLTSKLVEGLSKIEGIEIYGPKDMYKKIGVVSFAINGFHVKELAEYLASHKICVRYGSHCAFPLSDTLGNETLRVSMGVYNTEEDIDTLLQEINFFLDKKKGLIKNQNLEKLKNVSYSKRTQIVSNKSDILDLIKKSIHSNDTEVVVMGGHFLGIPDTDENRFYPSIKGLLPETSYNLLEEFGMTTFPIFTFDVATDIVSSLKKDGLKAKLLIVANDTTGINELRQSSVNKDAKTAEQYRDELLDNFKQKLGLPILYTDMLKEKGLALDDVINYGEDKYFKETILRANFKQFISNNKQYFEDVITYEADDESVDVSIGVLDNQQIKTCTFDTFHSKTGGKFCIVEVAQLSAELFGVANGVNFDYLNEKVKSPKVKAKDKVFVMLSPALCNNAVNSGGELYIKLFLQGQDDGLFKFINIPFGPNADKNMRGGVEITEIINK